MHTPDLCPQDEARGPARARPARAGLWLSAGVLALLLASALGAWTWAGHDGSLARALAWAQAWLDDPEGATGQLQITGAEGSLRQGGTVASLRWTRPGLTVQAQGLTVRWHSGQLLDTLLLRQLTISESHVDHLQVETGSTPPNREPLQSLELPWPVDLPWSIDRFDLRGRQSLQLVKARGHYRYAPVLPGATPAWDRAEPGVTSAHHLRVDTVTFAQGHYQLEAVLGAQAPLPLHAAAVGRVQTGVPNGEHLDLQAAASVNGTLAGTDALLAVQVHVLPAGIEGTPLLTARAQLMPEASQPLQALNAQAHALDLALLWPQAPSTAISGQVQAVPAGPVWRAQLDLRNARSGPWDQGRLPVDLLRGTLEQDGPLWRATDLQAALDGGQVQGSGHYRFATEGQTAQWAGELQARALNPARVWSRLAPARWTLRARAQQRDDQPDTIALDVQLQGSNATATADALQLRELRLLGQWRSAGASGVLRLDKARLDAAQVQLDAQGTLDMTERRFAGQGTVQLPGARGRLDGVLAAQDGQGTLDLRLDAVERVLAWGQGLQRMPVIGPSVADLLAHQPLLRDSGLTGQARLRAQWRGGLAPTVQAADGRSPASTPKALEARVDLEVPHLSAPARSGTDGWRVHQLQLQASGHPDDAVLQLRGQVTLGHWGTTLQTQGRVQGLRDWPASPGAPARLRLDGLTLDIRDTRSSAVLAGWALRTTQPLLLSASGSGPTLTLQAAAAQWQLQPQAADGPHPPRPSTTDSVLLAWDSLGWHNGVLQTRGRLRGLPLDWLDALTRTDHADTSLLTQAGLDSDMLFDGEWDMQLPLQSPGAPKLEARLQRRSGDLQMRSDAGETRAGTPAPDRRVSAGVRDAGLSLSLSGSALQARLRWDSERLGQINATLASSLGASVGATGPLPDRWWPASAPLHGTLTARLPQVGVWSALAPPGWRMRGTLQLDASLGGTRAAPDWRGTLQADQLALRSVIDGFEFSQGALRASLSGERVTIERFELQGPLGGTLQAGGQARWPVVNGQRQPQIDLQVSARQLRVSDRADRRLTLSGQVAAQLSGPRLNIRGQLQADSALFVLPDEATPGLSADVVVRGGRNLPPPQEARERVQPDVSVDLDLGPQFDVRGRGLQARLTGRLNLRSTPALPTPRVYGMVRTVSGSYRAYGQQLAIDTGELSFNGPYDDPALNVLAIRPMGRGTEQQVGVRVSGSAQAPRVRLVATPELPDAEKLAWLVLGRPATGAGAEAAILQQAALALLAGNDSTLNSGLAGALGLDDISYRSETLNADGSTRAAMVTLGKRLSNDLYLSYETGLAGALGTVSMFYDVSRRFTLRARAGEENAVDLIFTLRYD
ncbi:MAG: translocation/assembly module TamB domain-containing protein [Hydrogenophaga sp.]